MATLTVGSGQTYSTIRAAVSAAHSGDTITVTAGLYVNDFPNTLNIDLTLSGVGGVVHMAQSPGGIIPNGKAFLCAGDGSSTNTVTINDFEFSYASVPDANGAGIRFQSGHLICNRCYFHDNEMGILGGNGSGQVDLNACEFANNGTARSNDATHNIYLKAGILNCTGIFSHDVSYGHLLKSRSAVTNVVASRLYDVNGAGNYCIDLPNGGAASIRNCVIEKGVNAQNRTCLIAYAAESTNTSILPNSSLIVDRNTLLNDCPNLGAAVFNKVSNVAATVSNNLVWNIGKMLNGTGTVTGTITLTSEPALDMSSPGAIVLPPMPLPPTKATILAEIDNLAVLLDKLRTDVTQLP